MGSCGGRAPVTETSADTAAEAIGQGEMILGIDEELIQEALAFVADVAVVLLVEALGKDSVGKLSLVAPVVCAG